MKTLTRKGLALLLFISLLVPVYAYSGASALIDDSKAQACKGATLADTSTDDCSKKAGASSSRVTTALQNVINVLSIIVGIAAVILIIINGLRFILANGDSGAITTARNGVIYALVGVIIAASAQIVVRFLLNKV